MAKNTFTAGRGVNAQDLTRLGEAIAGNYVFPSTAGGAVTASSGLTVAVAAILANTVTINGTIETTAYAGGTVTAAAAHATLPRIDRVYYDQTGAIGIATGTAVAVTATTGPTPPTLADAQIAVADLYIAAAATVISTGDITDRRQPPTPSRLSSLLADIRDHTALLALFDAPMGALTTALGAGLGLTVVLTNSGAATATALGGGTITLATGTTGSSQAAICGGGNSSVGGARADRNPHFACILTSAASASALKTQGWGFHNANGVSTFTSTTATKALFRSVTTGALFAVTGNATSEETTSLAHTLGTAGVFEVYSEDDGVSWVFKVDGTVVATHTTTIPVVSTLMLPIVGIENNTTTSLSITACDLIYAYQDRS